MVLLGTYLYKKDNEPGIWEMMSKCFMTSVLTLCKREIKFLGCGACICSNPLSTYAMYDPPIRTSICCKRTSCANCIYVLCDPHRKGNIQ